MFPQASIHLRTRHIGLLQPRPFPNLIARPLHHRVAGLERTEYFDRVRPHLRAKRRGTFQHVTFTVPAFQGQTFTADPRVAHSLGVKTRFMPVELEVDNSRQQLARGMPATVNWPVKRAHPALVAPASAVAGNTERTFVIRGKSGVAE